MTTAFILAAVFFASFVALMVIGIVKKRRKPVYFSLVALLLSIGAGLWFAVLFASRTYTMVKAGENPLSRSGMEIYTALFNKPETACVKVLNKRDQVVPKLDCCIWLEFTTCPQELARIIRQSPYKPLDSTESLPTYDARPIWFRPDSLLAGQVLRYNKDSNHDQLLYFSADSTHAFYCDMAD